MWGITKTLAHGACVAHDASFGDRHMKANIKGDGGRSEGKTDCQLKAGCPRGRGVLA